MKKRFSSYAEPKEQEQTVFRPQLTSLIDVMTFLLVFLIKSFSVDSNIVTPSADLELPLSSSQKKPRAAMSIEITGNAVLSDGRKICSLGAGSDKDSMLLSPLYTWVRAQHSLKSDTAKKHEVLIQADRETEFVVLKRVMYTCSKAGFGDFIILAVQKG